MTFVNSTKTPSDGTLLEKTSRRFLWWLLLRLLWCWLLLFLRFRTTFPFHQHSTLASRACEGLHQLWALPWLLSITLLVRHIFTVSATVLSGHFLHTDIFYLMLLPNIWHNLLLPRPPRKTAVLPWRLQGLPLSFETQTRPICLFESHNVQQKVLVGKFYLRVTTGRLMKNLPLTGFELFLR